MNYFIKSQKKKVYNFLYTNENIKTNYIYTFYLINTVAAYTNNKTVLIKQLLNSMYIIDKTNIKTNERSSALFIGKWFGNYSIQKIYVDYLIYNHLENARNYTNISSQINEKIEMHVNLLFKTPSYPRVNKIIKKK